MKKNKVGIVILNYMTFERTIKCVNDLEVLSYNNFFVVIVDNNSPNESREKLHSEFANGKKLSFDIFLVFNDKNGGYAYGNNAGIYEAEKHGAEFTIIMNNDIIVETENFIENMIKEFKKKSNLAAIGPAIIEKGFIRPPAYKIRPSALSYISKNILFPLHLFSYRLKLKQYQSKPEATRVYALAGSCFALRISALREVDYLDENTFLYGEEVILGEKLYKKGYVVEFYPSIKVIHDHSYTISSSFNRVSRTEMQNKSKKYYLMTYRSDISKTSKYLIEKSDTIMVKVYIPLLNFFKKTKSISKDL